MEETDPHESCEHCVKLAKLTTIGELAAACPVVPIVFAIAGLAIGLAISLIGGFGTLMFDYSMRGVWKTILVACTTVGGLAGVVVMIWWTAQDFLIGTPVYYSIRAADNRVHQSRHPPPAEITNLPVLKVWHGGCLPWLNSVLVWSLGDNRWVRHLSWRIISNRQLTSLQLRDAYGTVSPAWDPERLIRTASAYGSLMPLMNHYEKIQEHLTGGMLKLAAALAKSGAAIADGNYHSWLAYTETAKLLREVPDDQLRAALEAKLAAIEQAPVVTDE